MPYSLECIYENTTMIFVAQNYNLLRFLVKKYLLAQLVYIQSKSHVVMQTFFQIWIILRRQRSLSQPAKHEIQEPGEESQHSSDLE